MSDLQDASIQGYEPPKAFILYKFDPKAGKDRIIAIFERRGDAERHRKSIDPMGSATVIHQHRFVRKTGGHET